MPKYKEINAEEFYKRLAKTLGVSIAVVKELHKGYNTVYLDCIKNGESFALPAIGTIKLIPYKTGKVRNPTTEQIVDRLYKYRFKFVQSANADRHRKEAE